MMKRKESIANEIKQVNADLVVPCAKAQTAENNTPEAKAISNIFIGIIDIPGILGGSCW